MADRARSLLIKFLGDSSSLDKETNGIVGRLGKIKTAVGEADGFFGKLKAGGSTALASVGGAGAVAGAGITAAAVAAAKGLVDFQRLGVEIGKGSEATGLSAEEFSRWREVAADAGVETSAFESTVGRFNKTLSASPATLAKFGVEVVKAADGTTDVNATFLNAIDTLNGIKDPAKQAEAGARLFGKSWQGMAELIGRGSGQLRQDLAAVSDAKVFDDAKVEQARRLRDAFDSISDAGEDLFLTIGSALAPVVAELAPKIAKVVEVIGPAVTGFGDLLGGVLGLVGPIVDLAAKLIGPLAEGLGKVASFVGDVVGGLGDLIDNVVSGGNELDGLTGLVAEHVAAQQEQREAILESNASFDDGAAKAEYYESRVEAAKDETLLMVDAARQLAGELDDTKAWVNAQRAVETYKAKIGDSNASLLDKRAALADVKSALLDYVTSLEGVPAEKQTQIIALLEQNKIDEAEAAINNLVRDRFVPVSIVTGGQLPSVPRFDSGGVVPGPRGKPTLIIAEGGETVLPTHREPIGRAAPTAAGGSSAGSSVTAQFFVLGNIDPSVARQLQEALDQLNRGNR